MATDIGKYSTNGYHRITRASGANFPFPYNDPPLAITPGLQNITYTSYHQPASISETVNSTPYLLEYTYDADQQRNYSKLRNMNSPGTPVEERWYEHGLETVRQGGSTSNTHKALYVEGGDGLCAIIAVGPTTTLTPYAVYKDHLGSIVTVTKPTGGGNSQIYVEQNFDAWGRHRSPTTWDYAEAVLPPWVFRGYTGHESVWPFTLTNMNGRMYDPLNGRMLSADNYVQGALGTQGYNRYSYAGNNPMKYTDPSGEFIPFVAVVAIAGVVGGGLNVWANWKDIQSRGGGTESFTRALAYFGTGAVVGAGAVVGGAALAPVIGTGAVSGAAFGAVGGFMAGFTNSSIANNWSDSRAAGNAGLQGLWMGAAGGAVLGGAISGIRGESFLWGSVPVAAGTAPGAGNLNRPSFNFKDSYKIGRADFWKYGRNLKPNVEFGNLTTIDFDGIQVRSGTAYSPDAIRGNYSFTKTTANHLDEYISRGPFKGELARPYMKSPLTINEIMNSGPGMPDAFFPGGLNWRVPGTFRGSQGIWELGINPQTNTIYHFLFR